MSVYRIRDNNGKIPENTLEYLTKRINGRTSMEAKELLNILKAMYDERLFIDNSDILTPTGRKASPYAWNPKSSFTEKMLQGGAFDSSHNLVNSLINVLAELGVTTFDFTGIRDMYTRCFISKEKRPRPVTFKGVFTIRDSFTSETHACCGKTIIDGALIIQQSRWRGRDIELPPKMKIGKILLLIEGQVSKEFDSDEAYRNRPERLSRLQRMKEIRESVVEANETGLLTVRDSYQVPLEVGCLILHSFGGRAGRLCTVVGQTSTHVKVRPLYSDKIQKIEPYNIVRIR